MAQKPSSSSHDPEDLPEVLQFMRSLWALAHALGRTSKRMNQDLGVTGPQRLVLRIVGLYPGVSAGQLAHILHVHPSTLTGVLQRLVDQRLLERTTADADRRRAQLRLTAKGGRINTVTEGTVESAVGRALRRSSPRDRAAAQRLFGALTDALAPRED